MLATDHVRVIDAAESARTAFAWAPRAFASGAQATRAAGGGALILG